MKTKIQSIMEEFDNIKSNFDNKSLLGTGFEKWLKSSLTSLVEDIKSKLPKVVKERGEANHYIKSITISGGQTLGYSVSDDYVKGRNETIQEVINLLNSYK